MDAKICTVCKTKRPFSDFYNIKNTKDGKRSACKSCTSTKAKIYREQNKDKIKEQNKRKYWKDVEKSRLESRNQYKKHRQRKLRQNKEWKKKNPDKYKKIHKEWYLKNRERKLKKNYEREKQEMNSNPMFRIKKNLRIRIYDVLRGKSKSKTTLGLLGCSIKELKERLESMFYDNMSWDNYGFYWHVDHIKPCSLFNLTDEEEQRKCFHYTNLQPLKVSDNLKKYNKYEDISIVPQS